MGTQAILEAIKNNNLNKDNWLDALRRREQSLKKELGKINNEIEEVESLIMEIMQLQ